MNKISETKNKFISLKNEFNEIVQDRFERSIDQEILEPSLNNFHILTTQEEVIKIQKLQIKAILTEARMLIPII